MANHEREQPSNGKAAMNRAILTISVTLLMCGVVVMTLLAYAFTLSPTECSVAANLMGRTDALFACLMQK